MSIISHEKRKHTWNEKLSVLDEKTIDCDFKTHIQETDGSIRKKRRLGDKSDTNSSSRRSSSSSGSTVIPAPFEKQVGIIVHTGIYNVSRYDNIELSRWRAANNLINNGPEWYLYHLMNSKPNKAALAVQNHHRKHYGNRDYFDFQKDFTYSKWDPDQWMKFFKSCGATYVVLTAKHHDGFCLWPTRTTPNPKSKMDIVGRFVEAARKHGLQVGIYYSWLEFKQNMTRDYIKTIVQPHIKELIRYKPDIFWFDGDWKITPSTQPLINECLDMIRRALPNILFNDRLGNKNERKSNPEWLGRASYLVGLDRSIPLKQPRTRWEHINSIGLSWANNIAQQLQDYKTPKQLADLYDKVMSMKGRFLLNMGPLADGTLCPIETNILLQFSKHVHLRQHQEKFKNVLKEMMKVRQSIV
jgi:alpha-L-fucosidase